MPQMRVHIYHDDVNSGWIKNTYNPKTVRGRRNERQNESSSAFHKTHVLDFKRCSFMPKPCDVISDLEETPKTSRTVRSRRSLLQNGLPFLKANFLTSPDAPYIQSKAVATTFLTCRERLQLEKDKE